LGTQQVPGLPLQLMPAAQPGVQVTVPPHPSGAVPQLLLPQAWATVLGTHDGPQVPAVPESGTLQVLPGVQVPHVSTPPHPSEAVPQLLLPHAWATVFGLQTHMPDVLLSVRAQVAAVPEQVPQLKVPPQPSGAVPQLLLPQACGTVSRTQASAAWQASLTSANSKKVFALLRQS
jgi:hypothetical protein